MASSSSLASPLCGSCMSSSVTCEKDQSQSPVLLQYSSLFASSSSPSSSKRLDRWARNRRKLALASQCCSGSTSSCLAFEPCNGFYSSKNGSFFGQNGSFSSFFESKNVSFNTNKYRKHPRLNRGAVHSGEAMAIAVQPTRETTTKKKPATKQRRVVVTGMGVVTPIGHDLDVFYNNLLEGVSGISEIEAFDTAQFPTRIAGEIKSLSTEGWVSPKLSKRMDKFMLYLFVAGKKALEDGGVTEDVMKELNKLKCGILIGSAMGGIKVFTDAIEALRISYKRMNPFCIPLSISNMGSAMLAMDLGWMGPNYSISTACATSNFCILNAANHIIRGEADVMLCGGSDAAIIPIGLGGFVACRALSQRNNDPTKASRPWDANRDGFVMGEGAGVLLLEELEHAKRRGATIYAEFMGGSFTCDAYHMTDPLPDGVGVIRCMEKALAQSGVCREDVNYINAHATSTPTGDINEYQALLHCFGKNRELRVNSTKSMIGHLLGASGAVEAIAAVQAIRTGWVHPNINLENPDEGVDANVLVGPKKERLNVKAALSNSFGFGGHNSSIIFAPCK